MQNRSTVYQIKVKHLDISLLKKKNLKRSSYYYPYPTCAGMGKINQMKKTLL